MAILSYKYILPVFLHSMHYEWLHFVTFTKCLAWSRYRQPPRRQASANAHEPMGHLLVGCSQT